MSDLTTVAWVIGGCLVLIYGVKTVVDLRRYKVDTDARVAAFRDGFERGVERGGHPSTVDITQAPLPKVPPGSGPGSDVRHEYRLTTEAHWDRDQRRWVKKR